MNQDAYSVLVTCSVCGTKNNAMSSDYNVMCVSCGHLINIKEELLKKNETSPKGETEAVQEEKNMTVFFNDYLDNLNWDEFARDYINLTLPNLDMIIKEKQISESQNSLTWILSSRYLYRVIITKIEYIEKGLEYINNVSYDSSDFDKKYTIKKQLEDSKQLIIDSKNTIMIQLNSYADYARLTGADSDTLALINNNKVNMDQILKNYSFASSSSGNNYYQEESKKVLPVDEISTPIIEVAPMNSVDDDIVVNIELEDETLKLVKNQDVSSEEPVVEKEEIREEITEETNQSSEPRLIKDQRPVNGLIQEAKELYSNGAISKAVKTLVSVVDESLEARLLLEKINHISKLPFDEQKFIYVMNSTVYKKEANELYPLVDGLFKTTSVANSENVLELGIFGGYYFFRDKKKIKFLNVSGEANTDSKKEIPEINLYGKLTEIVDQDDPENLKGKILFLSQVKKDDYKDKKRFYNKYMKNILKPRFDFQNEFDLIEVDLINRNAQVLVANIHEFFRRKDENIYYSCYPVIRRVFTKNHDIKTLMVLNTAKNDTRELIKGEYQFIDVLKDKTVLFERKYGIGNKSLYYRRPEDEEAKVLVNNVYRYIDRVSEQVFFVVGSEALQSLCSIKIGNKEHIEVLKYMQDVAFFDDQYLYIIAGETVKTLYRQAFIGGKPEIVASGIIDANELVDYATRVSRIHNNYLYFCNYQNILCKVNLATLVMEELVYAVSKLIKITNTKMYYLAIDKLEDGRTVKSLYSINSDGSNRSKLIFNVISLDVFDNDTVVFLQKLYLDNEEEIYRKLTNNKLAATSRKMYMKLRRRGIKSETEEVGIFKFRLEENTVETIGFLRKYPTLQEIKLEMKARLQKRKV